MITINKGLAGVIPDFIRQQEMESRWQRSLSLFRKLIWMYGEPLPPHSRPLTPCFFSFIRLSQKTNVPWLCPLC